MKNTKYKNKSVLNITIDNDLYEKIEKHQKETLVSKSAFVNKILGEYFNKISKK